jgi:hypothetical protein
MLKNVQINQVLIRSIALVFGHFNDQVDYVCLRLLVCLLGDDLSRLGFNNKIRKLHK